jgi:hypothetical protein
MLDHPIKQQPEKKQHDCPNPEMAALFGRLGWISSELVRRGGLGSRRLLVHSLFLCVAAKQSGEFGEAPRLRMHLKQKNIER